MAKVQTMEYDMLDIIFSTRNKLYGAYFLRRLYAKNLGKSLFYGLILIGSFYAVPFLMKAANSGLIDKPIDVTIDMSDIRDIDPNTPTPPPPPKIVTPPPVTRSTQIFIPPVVLEDNAVKEELQQKAIEELKTSDAEVGKKELKGNDEAPPTITQNPVDLKVVETAKEAPKVDDEVYIFVEKSPSFPGGEAELLKFLAENIKYPPLAQESGIQGRVFVQFVVKPDGSISDVRAVKDIGGGCGKEAERIVRAMPKWIAGEQNGRKVSVKYTLPVMFKLQ